MSGAVKIECRNTKDPWKTPWETWKRYKRLIDAQKAIDGLKSKYHGIGYEFRINTEH